MTTPTTETAVLKRWDRGETSIKIGNDLNIRPAYVRTIVQRARSHGDKRAHMRTPGRPRGIPVNLTSDVLATLTNEAERRGATERELATTIISTVLTAGLVGAVLDDGEAA